MSLEVVRSASPMAMSSGPAGVEAVLAYVRERSEELARLDLHELLELHHEADELAELTRLKRYKRMQADADAAQHALEMLCMRLKQRVGKLFAELEPGKRGRGHQGERTRVAEALGVAPTEMRRMVKLADMGDEAEDLAGKLVENGKRITVSNLLTLKRQAPSAGSDEWYTPELITEPLHGLWPGGPDQDLASCPVAQRLIGAKQWWSAGDHHGEPGWAGRGRLLHALTGLEIVPDLEVPERKRAKAFAKIANALGRLDFVARLAGRLWCNPPYAFPGPFIRAILEGLLGYSLDSLLPKGARPHEWPSAAAVAEAMMAAAGPVDEAILLVNTATGTAAQQWLLAAASAEVWIRGRIAFRDRDGVERPGNRAEQVLYHLGARPSRFLDAFAHLGVGRMLRGAP